MLIFHKWIQELVLRCTSERKKHISKVMRAIFLQNLLTVGKKVQVSVATSISLPKTCSLRTYPLWIIYPIVSVQDSDN